MNCGRDYDDESFDDGYTEPAPVGSYPDGASWVGALDLAGNVYEWVADWYGAYPAGPVAGSQRVTRRGRWAADWRAVRAAYRTYELPRERYSDGGFRCVSPPGE